MLCIVAVAAPISADAEEQVTFVSAKKIEADIRGAPEKGPGVSWVDYAATPKYLTGVIRRTDPGKAEVHQGMTDVWYIIAGSGTLITGGDLVEPVETDPGELRGEAISGGDTRVVAKGDIITIPAGVPHWVSKIDREIVYLIVKASAK